MSTPQFDHALNQKVITGFINGMLSENVQVLIDVYGNVNWSMKLFNEWLYYISDEEFFAIREALVEALEDLASAIEDKDIEEKLTEYCDRLMSFEQD